MIIYSTCISILAVAITIYDKQASIHKKWRISEMHLFLIAFFGGASSMLLIMRLIHHKTKKKRFMFLLPLMMCLHLLLLIFWLQGNDFLHFNSFL